MASIENGCSVGGCTPDKALQLWFSAFLQQRLFQHDFIDELVDLGATTERIEKAIIVIFDLTLQITSTNRWTSFRSRYSE